MFSHIFFDLDGTLTNPYEGITNSVRHALEKFGIIVADKNKLTPFIGPPLYKSFMKFYGFNEAQAEKAVEYYREYFSDKGIFENSVYIGIADMLKSLCSAGARLYVATSKPEQFAKRIISHFGLEKYFVFVAGATMDSQRVEKSDVIAYALETARISDLSKAVMVGDREHDILGAKANGLKSIGVTYGFGTRAELEAASADFIADSPLETQKIVLSYN